ncbi:hypothetical protein BGZ82_004515, partial [Podila clonocystis]
GQSTDMMNQFFLAPSADSSLSAASDPTSNPAANAGPSVSATSNSALNSVANAGPSTLTVAEQQRRSLLPDLPVDEQREILLDWLETDDNVGAVLGRQHTEIGKTETTRAIWTRAAQHYNGELPLDKGHFMDWNKLYQRFQRYKKAYFKSAFGGRQTGDGVDPAEGDDGYDDKEERLCPGFDRLHAMFKNNPHLRPACEVQTASGQLRIGSRAGETFLGSADEPDDRDAVYISDEDQDLEDEENSGDRLTA